MIVLEKGTLKTPLGRVNLYWFGSGSKVVTVISGIHGDEHNSVFAVRYLMRLLKRTKNFDWRVLVIPVANPNAFRYTQRVSAVDGLDLNRVFPGDTEGFATERHASAVWGIVRSSDVIIDVHTCEFCEEYVLTLYEEYKEARWLADRIAIKNIVESYGTSGQLFVSGLKGGIPSAIIEIPQKFFVVDLRVASSVGKKLYQTLINIGAIDGKPLNVEHSYYSKLIRHHADYFGLYKPSAKLGGFVNKGEPIGYVNQAIVKARTSGKVFIQKPRLVVKPGEVLAGVAPPKNKK